MLRPVVRSGIGERNEWSVQHSDAHIVFLQCVEFKLSLAICQGTASCIRKVGQNTGDRIMGEESTGS